jgi:2,4-dienoyl-CoA reductase-like NADH-dependent reductase (Old Yellow Enzyme family)
MNAPTLFTPVRLGAVEAPNRLVMAPLTWMRAATGRAPTPLMAVNRIPAPPVSSIMAAV